MIILKEFQLLHQIFQQHNVSENSKKELIQGILNHGRADAIVKRDSAEKLLQDLKELAGFKGKLGTISGMTYIYIWMEL